MRRTQIYLTEGQRRTLDAVAERTGRSVSALIREAVRIAYGGQSSATDDLGAMRASFGSWGDREADSTAWVDRLRQGHRSAY